MLAYLLLTAAQSQTTAPELSVSAASAVVMDAASGKILYSKNGSLPRYPASTTKIMTSLLLLERCRPEEMITAPAEVEKIPESSMHLKPGERVSAEELLYAMMLRSANDACVAVATHISGSVKEFSALMNARAKELGCTNTTFNNPNGLNDKSHKTSARDLALIAREAMKLPEFRAVARTQKRKITRSINQEDLWMVNKNKWLKEDGTADGIKTGWTIPAGKCFVGSATRDGYRLITVVLKSEDWVADNKKMLDWAFKNHTFTVGARIGDPAGEVPVKNGELRTVPIQFAQTVEGVSRKSPEGWKVEPPAFQAEAPIKRGQPLGTLTLIDPDGTRHLVPVTAMEEVALQTTLAGFRPSTLGGISLLALAGGLYAYKRRRTGYFS